MTSSVEYDIEEPILRNERMDINCKSIDRVVDDLLTQGKRSYIQVAENRLSNGIQVDTHDTYSENGKQQIGSKRVSGTLLSGICYCISSCSMILLNKVVLSSYNFEAGISLMLYQNFISVVIVVALGLFGVVSTEKLTWKLIRVWIPVNVIFVGMLVTGMFSLKYINVAMVTILKNLTNILTATGEISFQEAPKCQSLDCPFSNVGYTWQTMNCVLTASYSGCHQDTNVLGGLNCKWITRTFHKFYLYVVLKTNRANNLQPGGIIEQDPYLPCWYIAV